MADRLQLNPIVGPEENTAPNQTQFLIPIDHKDSGSGVSAECRAITIRALSDEHAQAKDFVRPGHIHPLLAKQGGILRRAGHTEATGDLLQMAGLKPVGVLIEILSQKGFGMADAQELREISEQFDIPIISTAEVIRHRYISEKLVHREVEVPINTKNYGTVQVIGYSVEHESQQPVALVWGDLHSVEAPRSQHSAGIQSGQPGLHRRRSDSERSGADESPSADQQSQENRFRRLHGLQPRSRRTGAHCCPAP